MECFVTGGTGFIGQHLVANLSAKGHTIRVLMRRPERLAALREQVDILGGRANRVFAVAGDLEQDNLELSVADREVLRRASVIFHLGAHFAWGLSVEYSRAVNVEAAKRVALLAVEQKSRLVMIGAYMLKNHEYIQRSGIDPRYPDRPNWPAVYRRVGGYEGSKLEAHFATLEVLSAKGGELSELLGKYPECTVIDWSAGRLACIEAEDVSIEALADIIQDVAEAVWDDHSALVDASYEEMSRA